MRCGHAYKYKQVTRVIHVVDFLRNTNITIIQKTTVTPDSRSQFRATNFTGNAMNQPAFASLPVEFFLSDIHIYI